MKRPLIRYAIEVAGLFVLYFSAAKLGLMFDAMSGVATTVWPPTGLSLAALLIAGTRLWPGITLAAFLVNAQADVPIFTAAGIAAGNTLEALLGATLLSRVGFRSSMDRIRDVVALVLLAALLSTTVSATFGAVSLGLGGVAAPRGYGVLWWVWWVGDLMGDLLVAPLLLVWVGAPRMSTSPRRMVEAGALGVSVIAVSVVAFRGISAWHRLEPFDQSYMILPLLVWAALRFGQRGAVTATFLVSVIAIRCTVAGQGPFARASRGENLLSLQTFMAVVSVTVLILGAAISERKKAVHVRDEFMSIASHELRTPVTTLRLRLERLLRIVRRTPDASPESLTGAIEASVEQVDKLARLTDDLLDLARIEAGRLKLDIERFDLGELVRAVVERFREQAAAVKCSIEIHVPHSVIGEWDRFRLDQLVTNLLTNAMKYGQGKPISVSLREQGDRVELVVRDQGVGIDKKDQGRIFERFERASDGRKAPGLGLGLYIVRQIVDAHGGSVRVDSAKGAGATFTVELPPARRA